jgi:hypothetical protein
MSSRGLATLFGVLAIAAPVSASAGGPTISGVAVRQTGQIAHALNGYDVALTYVGPGSVGYGQIATFTFKAFNNGPATVSGPSGVMVVVTFPANFDYPTTLNAPGWNCSRFDPSGIVTMSCSYGGAAAANTALSSIVITLQAKHKGGFANCAQISLTVAPDANPEDNRSCVDGAVL